MQTKTIHQIWINRDSPRLPDHLQRMSDTWKRHHPHWTHRLWNLENLDFEPACAALLPQCQHPAQMADLLRMEILWRHGGIYVDTDFECLRPLDDILVDVDEFGCSEDGRFVSIGILGARPESPLYREVLASFPEKLGRKPVNVETGPAFFTEVLLRSGFRNDYTLFPSYYFFPFNYHTADRSSADLSRSYAVHHYEDSWKKPQPMIRRLIARLRRHR